MFKIDLDFNLKNLDGKELEGEGFHVGKTLASVMAGVEKASVPPIKLMDWAQTLWKREPILIDETDKGVLTAMVEASERMTNHQKATILRVFKSAEKTDLKAEKGGKSKE